MCNFHVSIILAFIVRVLFNMRQRDVLKYYTIIYYHFFLSLKTRILLKNKYNVDTFNRDDIVQKIKLIIR